MRAPTFLSAWKIGAAGIPAILVAAVVGDAGEQRDVVADGVRVATSGGLSAEWDQRLYAAEHLWAYRPLVKPQLHHGVEGEADAVDFFIDRRLRDLGIDPTPRADRPALIRRATFDLTGLPPSQDEVAAFLADPRDDDAAFRALVHRLLASPHYGEQWTRHWLDVVRYADTSGFANDYERPNAWRYRDYVIRSLNEDTPFNRFIIEQLAGDELDPHDPEMRIAVGFLRMGPWEQTGMSVARLTRQQFLDDVTNSVGEVFLSHPLRCARCHDHKYDPIPTRDYYAIQAVFATTQFAERDAAFLTDENTGGFDAERAYLEQRIDRYEAELRRIERKEEAAAREWYAARGLEYAPRNELQKEGVADEKIAPRHVGLSTYDFGMERIARKNLVRHRWELDRFRPIAFSVYSGATRLPNNVQSRIRMPNDPLAVGEIEATAILAGGDPFSPTEVVTPGVLSCVAAGDDGRITNAPRGRRLAFARWVASADNPLTARSIVNRVWQYHFGRGIASNSNNFGQTGGKPTHPELLDWLAADFVEHGWSLKRLHQRIMLSDAYARASVHSDSPRLREIDPDGKSYAAFQPRRLAAEEIRDAMLAVSGELNRELGGISIRPDMDLEVALQPRQIMGTYAPAYQPSPRPEERNRRSIYAMRIRGLRDPFLETFSQPPLDLSCERREGSTVTPQALTLLNSEEVHDRALALAVRLLGELEDSSTADASEADVIRRAFLLCFSRPPEEGELATCLDHWHAMAQRHDRIEISRADLPREVTRHAIEEMNGEPFTFTERLEVYDNYVADRKPWDVDARTRALADVCLVLLNANEFLYVP
jgi:hypothetical protein